MQYLVSVIHDKLDLAPSDEMAAIDAFNDRLQAEESADGRLPDKAFR